jgi:hypothetical protein
METNMCKKTYQNYVCDYCDFTCCLKTDYERHLLRPKHQKNVKINEKSTKNIFSHFICEICDKKYKERTGLWKHKKRGCSIKPSTEEQEEDSKGEMNLLTQLIMEMMKSNQDLQKSLIEVCKNGASQSNNTQISNSMVNSNNKTFNLQVFLNETCKDAMNLTDFVDSLQIQIADLEKVGKDGFVNGISNIIVKNLKALDVTMRPVHCSDQKRETMYVKDDNQWFNDSKEQPDNQKLKKAIKQIAHKNICLIPEWKKLYPDCVYADSKKSDIYNHIVYESMDHNEANSEKIIKKIAKEVGINK